MLLANRFHGECPRWREYGQHRSETCVAENPGRRGNARRRPQTDGARKGHEYERGGSLAGPGPLDPHQHERHALDGVSHVPVRVCAGHCGAEARPPFLSCSRTPVAKASLRSSLLADLSHCFAGFFFKSLIEIVLIPAGYAANKPRASQALRDSAFRPSLKPITQALLRRDPCTSVSP